MQKHGVNGYHSLTFFLYFFSLLRIFCFTLELKVLISDVGMYPLHAHDIKSDINPLTPNQIMFCLAVMKKNINLKIPILVDLHQIKCFIFIQP